MDRALGGQCALKIHRGNTDRQEVRSISTVSTVSVLLAVALTLSSCERDVPAVTEEALGSNPRPAAADAASDRSSAATVPGFCADEDGRTQAGVLFQVMPQLAAAKDGGRDILASPIAGDIRLDALARHLDAVDAAPPAEPGGVIKAKYIAAMRASVDAYTAARAGDPSKLAPASEALFPAYLAFVTPYACS